MKTRKAKKYPVRLPKGWTLEEVEEVRKYYDAQTEEEAAAEIEAAFRSREVVVMTVPWELVPRMRKMIAEHMGKGRGKARKGKGKRARMLNTRRESARRSRRRRV